MFTRILGNVIPQRWLRTLGRSESLSPSPVDPGSFVSVLELAYTVLFVYAFIRVLIGFASTITTMVPDGLKVISVVAFAIVFVQFLRIYFLLHHFDSDAIRRTNDFLSFLSGPCAILERALRVAVACLVIVIVKSADSVGEQSVLLNMGTRLGELLRGLEAWWNDTNASVFLRFLDDTPLMFSLTAGLLVLYILLICWDVCVWAGVCRLSQTHKRIWRSVRADYLHSLGMSSSAKGDSRVPTYFWSPRFLERLIACAFCVGVLWQFSLPRGDSAFVVGLLGGVFLILFFLRSQITTPSLAELLRMVVKFIFASMHSALIFFQQRYRHSRSPRV